MEAVEQTPIFIHTRRGAIVALCVTSYLAVQEVWACFVPPPEHFHWLMFDRPPDFGLPAWAIAAINLAFSATLLSGCIGFYRASQGKERILVAGFSVSILGFIKPLLPGDLAIPVRYAQAAGMIVAAIAAGYIIFERPPKPSPANQASKTITAILSGAAILLGLLITVTDFHSGWISDSAAMAGLALGAAAFSLINRSRPWLWAVGVYVPIPVFYAISPPRNLPWVPSEPTPFGMNNRAGQSVEETLAFLLVAMAGAYAGMLIRKLLESRTHITNSSSTN